MYCPLVVPLVLWPDESSAHTNSAWIHLASPHNKYYKCCGPSFFTYLWYIWGLCWLLLAHLDVMPSRHKISLARSCPGYQFRACAHPCRPFPSPISREVTVPLNLFFAVRFVTRDTLRCDPDRTLIRAHTLSRRTTSRLSAARCFPSQGVSCAT